MSGAELATAPATPAAAPLPEVDPAALRRWSRFGTLPMTALLASSDLVMALSSTALAVLLRLVLGGQFTLDTYVDLWPLLPMVLAVYALAGLYPAVAVTRAEEIRRITLATALIFVILGAALFVFRSDPHAAERYSRGVFFLALAQTVILVPVGRAIVRMLFSRKPWWGAPALIIGSGEIARETFEALRDQPGLGMRPVAVLEDSSETGRIEAGGGTGGSGPRFDAALLAGAHVPFCILALADSPRQRLLQRIEHYCKLFPRVIVVPDLFGYSVLWVSGRDLGGVLGLEVRQQLLRPGPRLLKRLFDLACTLPAMVVGAPLYLAAMLAVRLSGPGPIFYGQKRIGQGGRPFRVWKFRSMVKDADRALQAHLAADPAARAEWEANHKLRDDPRITRIGAFLRASSIDELPQLWNVLRGEMSLVGPRPIVAAEAARYEQDFSLYGRVKPGLTGLWQVSGRSDTTYAERVHLDAYYVRNWSLWLDLAIIGQTVWVVTVRRGAY
jgi:Undecaprenyl-phosphate galactose phosphotransferase WbaP